MADGRNRGSSLVSEIRIYFEGGGEERAGKTRLRQGFHAFFQEVIALARDNRVKFQLVACGRRSNAYRNFCNAIQDHARAFNVLLVDSEEAVDCDPWTHLRSRDGWTRPDGIEDRHCHLMAQAMEAWFVADIETLRGYYGVGFNPNPVPNNPDVEQIPKNTLESSLKAATRNTQKGEYHKIRHASAILERLSAEKVQGAAKHCRRLFESLESEIERD